MEGGNDGGTVCTLMNPADEHRPRTETAVTDERDVLATAAPGQDKNDLDQVHPVEEKSCVACDSGNVKSLRDPVLINPSHENTGGCSKESNSPDTVSEKLGFSHEQSKSKPIGGESTEPSLPSDGKKDTDSKLPNVVLSGELLPTSFRSQSLSLARDTVYFVCRSDEAMPPVSKTAVVMRSLVQDTLNARVDMMQFLASTLEVKSREQLHLINNITNYLFEDQRVTWGRIITMFSFCGYLAKHCEDSGIPDCAEDVSRILGNIVVNRLGLWILVNGGWVSESIPPSV